ncbi:uncharacterized protein METZ01_LOCUS180531 [marine metagenome]|uniref:Uncharacterized protein n=1 Tax=marine metagenome TaxID=408172 RepID=A0A382CQX3_9ZZZZ
MMDWHKKYVLWWQKKLGISNYGFLWFSFIKGVVFTLIIIWLLGKF